MDNKLFKKRENKPFNKKGTTNPSTTEVDNKHFNRKVDIKPFNKKVDNKPFNRKAPLNEATRK